MSGRLVPVAPWLPGPAAFYRVPLIWPEGEESGYTGLSCSQSVSSLPCPLQAAHSSPSISSCLNRPRKRKGSWPTPAWVVLSGVRGGVGGGYLGPSNIWWPKYQDTDNHLLHFREGPGDLMAEADQGDMMALSYSLGLPLCPRASLYGRSGVESSTRGLKQT